MESELLILLGSEFQTLTAWYKNEVWEAARLERGNIRLVRALV